MKRNIISGSPALLALVLIMAVLTPTTLVAHCDTMDGPVVLAAKKALETGNVNLVLIWVQKKDDGQITGAFQKTLAVRKLNPEARELADMYFFETLVRIHRAGEGAPYTGLKPSGTPLEPGVAAADAALEKGSAAALLKDLTDSIRHGVERQFNSTMEKKSFNEDDVTAGREYVEAYVGFIQAVERLYEAARNQVHGHYPEGEQVGMQKEH